MSSYFVNSFCGRYPNGADYPLHNYGDHSSSGQCRDSSGMHSGRYAYGYNGMDLSTGRSTTGHFLSSVERTQSYTDSPTTTPVRYSQPVTASSAETSSDPLPCSSLANSPVSEQSHRALKTSLPSTAGSETNSVGTVLNREDVSKASSIMEEEKPPGSAQTASQNVSEAPQIYPWMRKLHISHGKRKTKFCFLCLCSECWSKVWMTPWQIAQNQMNANTVVYFGFGQLYRNMSPPACCHVVYMGPCLGK